MFIQMPQLQENLIKSNSVNYQNYLLTMTKDQKENWKDYQSKIVFDKDLEAILKSPSLPINIIVFSGAWCPECALAVSILEKMTNISSYISLHILDREKLIDVYENYRPNGDSRVPVVLFTSEDFFLVSMWIERSSLKFGLLWKVLQESKLLDKQQVFDQLAKTYQENENAIIQSTIDEIASELIRTIGTINYSTRLQTAL
jgi:hypothetical protein